jgi:hypothetical protein
MRIMLCMSVVALLSLLTPHTGSLAQAQTSPQTPFDRNLILNGDAEGGPGAPNDGTIQKPPNWTVTGNFTAVQYGASGGFPAPTDPGPANRGRNFFAGGPSNERSEAAQTIALAPTTDIDAGNVGYRVSGYLGGFEGQEDNAVVRVAFMSEGSERLAEATLGPVTSALRQGKTGLLQRTTTGTVPKGARRAVVTVTMSRDSGSYNDGYADNLELVLTKR